MSRSPTWPTPMADAALAARRSRRLLLALVVNALVVVAQVVAGISAHSLGLLADAGHNLADVAALALSLLAVRLSRRPPTASRSFGYHRSTVLAAQANAAALLVVTGIIAVEAVRRLAHPGAVGGGVVLAVALVSLVLNALSASLLVEHDHRDLNMRSAAMHLASDAMTSAGIAAAGGVILVTGRLQWLDPAVALAVAALISVQALRLVREATEVLLESTPAGLDIDALVGAMAEVAGVDEVHDVHAWSLSSEVRALSAHLVLAGHPTLEEAQQVSEAVKAAIWEPFGIQHATLELECETCVDGDAAPCSIDERSATGPPMAGHAHRRDRH